MVQKLTKHTKKSNNRTLRKSIEWVFVKNSTPAEKQLENIFLVKQTDHLGCFIQGISWKIKTSLLV